ncbi:MAG: hypothetical protein QM728_01050 [Gordonia sp. (in: high G+C Gram-positive bacteria)]|uniref:hypothetical protein n=1 Tax=Gordonia sp. (in: high G+C Gram-positive bacteria) TaxID=84139 RepID=UPI0039E7127F
MRRTIAALLAAAAATLTFNAAPAHADPAIVKLYADGYRLVTSVTNLPEGRKTCDFDRSQPNPFVIIGSFGNDMIRVRNRKTSGDAVTIKSRYLPRGKYLTRMACFIKNRRTGVYTIVAVDEQWVHITGRRAPREAAQS